MPKILDKLEKNCLVRQGHQLWHAHQALKTHSEHAYIMEMAEKYVEVGRVATVAEGVVVAASLVTAYRSNEAGERVPQRAREKLDADRARQKADHGTQQEMDNVPGAYLSRVAERQRAAAFELFGKPNDPAT
jgi:hypothetical protein